MIIEFDLIQGVVIELNLVNDVIIQNTVVEGPVLEFDIMTGGKGADAIGSLETWPAGENVSTGRVVIIDAGAAIYFQPSDLAHSGRAYGITKTSATTGNDVSIQLIGEVSDPAFSFAADVGLYVAANGQITATKPSSGLIQFVGSSTDINKFRVEFWPTIES